MIYATSVDSRIIIDGIDYLEQLVDIVYTDDYITDTGLVTTKATATLNAGVLPINNWADDIFRIGSIVTVDIDTESTGVWQRHPRGYSILIGVAYDSDTNTSELELMCPISAKIAQRTTYSQLLVDPGTFQSVINQMFLLSGFPVVIWNISENYNIYSRPEMTSGYLETIGKMLADACAYAWVNGNGEIEINPIVVLPSTLIGTIPSAEMISAKQVLIGKPPTKLAKVSGTYRKHTNRQNIRTLVVPSRGDIGSIVPGAAGTGIITQLTTIDTLSPLDKTVSNIKTEDRLGFQVYSGLSGYPRTSTVRATRTVETKIYSAGRDDKLQAITRVSNSIRYIVLKSFCDWAIEKRLNIGLSSDTLLFTENEYFEFDSREQPLSILRVKTEPIGVVFASIPGVDWQIIYDAFGVPDDPIVTEREITRWVPISPGEWKKVTITTISNIRLGSNGQGIEEKIKRATRSALIGIYRNAVVCGSSTIVEDVSTTGQVTPGSVERYPYVIGLEKLNISVDLTFNGFRAGWETQPKGYSVEYCPDTVTGESQLVIDFIRRYGQIWHLLSIQRWQALRSKIPFRSEVFNYKPYGQFKIVDDDANYIVAFNGTTWLVEPERAVISSDCALIAIEQNGFVRPKYSVSVPLTLSLAIQMPIVSTTQESTPQAQNLALVNTYPLTTVTQGETDEAVLNFEVIIVYPLSSSIP